METASKAETVRLPYLDYLRVMAAAAVIMIHVSAQNWDNVPVMSSDWIIFNLYNSLAQWAVPMFLMLSGALMLDPGKPFQIRTLYRKNILRILTAFLFWSALYALDTYFANRDWRGAVVAFVNGRYHMWFLFMILGFYLLTPAYRKMAESVEVLRYLIAVMVVFTLFLPTVISLLIYWNLPHTATILPPLDTDVSWTRMGFLPAYATYYFLGSYLNQQEVGKKARIVSYLLGISAYLFVLALTFCHEAKTGDRSLPLYVGFFDFLICHGIFLFVKYGFPVTSSNSVKKLSQYSFGIYLAHVFVIEKLRDWAHFNTLSFSPVLAIPLLATAVFSLSFLISWVLHQIPVLKKYVV